MKKTRSRKSCDTVPLILSWFRKKCNPSWFTDLMMKNKVAVLNQGTNSKICALFIFKAGVWCSSVVSAPDVCKGGPRFVSRMSSSFADILIM
jgi:hypothetical protein